MQADGAYLLLLSHGRLVAKAALGLASLLLLASRQRGEDHLGEHDDDQHHKKEESWLVPWTRLTYALWILWFYQNLV